ncbi:hypothetical protein BU14_0055s0044 [Porphyra umbilicalis]|uniref:Uncharacterized protein n=1 Tax=Porphyra umbilicalis TaxID=2786 RepID=A0A1X6PHK0_PORUM|nr:hypothetical protein BU14_0055s0044 [Porphyra umbilicalis]|eukprot:OSX80322.1 hypothetical protein BU14_0055s0044 [Porphyra umbilicalis]
MRICGRPVVTAAAVRRRRVACSGVAADDICTLVVDGAACADVLACPRRPFGVGGGSRWTPLTVRGVVAAKNASETCVDASGARRVRRALGGFV